MLQLENIVKNYRMGDETVTALKGVSLSFREHEFVAILGPSGCGKTTMLNLIGGLDRYTSGDLRINGVSTKQYKSGDWDTYRNHSVGFVFQNYNLISHQTVLANVELSMTLSGVSRSERRARAVEALKRVGLGDQLRKKPNQMSGGQMQRVAIARALVNDPDILLADEPTGALDSETSVQIMELLKEISKDKLIIMVTHNPELAEQYANRIIRLLDGRVVDDSRPFEAETEQKATAPVRVRKPSMSLGTALSLSLNNLLTKKARTFLTSFAGSIGIIGIALILSLSTGLRRYISQVEEETLSNYPIAIEESTMDVGSLLESFMGKQENKAEHDTDKIYSTNVMTDMIDTMLEGVSTNNLKAFKAYLEEQDNPITAETNAIQYTYKTALNVYKADTADGVFQVNPSQVFSQLGMGMAAERRQEQGGMMSQMSSGDVWQELIDNQKLLESQYEVVDGRMPTAYDEIVLMVNRDNEVTDYTLYALGLKDIADVKEMFKAATEGTEIPEQEVASYTYGELLGLRFKLLVNSDYFEKDQNGLWVDRSQDELYLMQKLNDAVELKIVGILKPAEGATVSGSTGIIGYRADLMRYLIDRVNESDAVKAQQATPDTDIFTGMAFKKNDETVKPMTMDEIRAFLATQPAEQQAAYGATLGQMQQQGMSEEQIGTMFAQSIAAAASDSTYDDNLLRLGAADLNSPSGINLYPKNFESKETISDLIADYNAHAAEADQITYTDYIGLLMSSVTTIINAISIILISFVAISLVVSSIMIGIITYISVLERTKEIGILRAMGASKKDIARVFNAETMIVGLVAGALGIGITLLLVMLANVIIYPLTDIPHAAQLPVAGAVVLVIISMVLTLIAGIIPSRMAARKDPVEALRTE